MSGISNNKITPEVLGELIKKENPELVVLATNDWHLPVHKQSVTFSLSVMRKANAIEEYIMRAASLELSHDIDTSMLSQLMGLDETFTDASISLLSEKGILDSSCLPLIKLTEQGKTLTDDFLVFDKDMEDLLEYYIDLKTTTVYPSLVDKSYAPMHPDAKKIETGIENAKKYINRRFLRETASIAGKEIDSREKCIRLKEIVSVRTADAKRTLFTEIALFDQKSGSVSYKIWDHAKKCFRDDLVELFKGNGIRFSYEIVKQ